jgi:hypothetical protein
LSVRSNWWAPSSGAVSPISVMYWSPLGGPAAVCVWHVAGG